jgi:hypothetical protein
MLVRKLCPGYEAYGMYQRGCPLQGARVWADQCNEIPAFCQRRAGLHTGLSGELAGGVACEDLCTRLGQEPVAGVVGGVYTVLHDFDRDMRQKLFE